MREERLPSQIIGISDNKRVETVSFIQSPHQSSTEMPERQNPRGNKSF